MDQRMEPSTRLSERLACKRLNLQHGAKVYSKVPPSPNIVGTAPPARSSVPTRQPRVPMLRDIPDQKCSATRYQARSKSRTATNLLRPVISVVDQT